MAKKIIFQDTFLVSGIMCFSGCGARLEGILKRCFDACKQNNLLPAHAELVQDAEPQALGIQRLLITVENDDEDVNPHPDVYPLISTQFKEAIQSIGFKIIDNHEAKKKEKSNRVNWINMVVNLLAMGAIVALSIIFPPSLLLTLGLTAISFVTTAITARDYLINCIRNLRDKNIANMSTTITLGWLLSLAHTVYHVITMPLTHGFSMLFMNFIMPIMLIAGINGMDEIKRLILNKSEKMHLQGIQALFPQMADEYSCCPIAEHDSDALSVLMGEELHDADALQDLLNHDHFRMKSKNSLKQGMLIKIKGGECFPVDCMLMEGNALVDASLLTGEPQQGKQRMDFIPAGAVNLGGSVTVYATKDSYHSTVNQLLFRANRAKENRISAPSNRLFTYLYAALIIIGIVASIITPLAFGLFSISLLLQNITGILFAICPCTMAIAHQLPSLLSIYRRGNKGIILSDENLSRQSDEIHTVVFDKTGTLTTGNSQVESSEGISEALWQRIYLLEKQHGAEHPLANAITRYYEEKAPEPIMMNDINSVSADSKNRGLSATVQGREIHIGNLAYLQQQGIALPLMMNSHKMEQGFSPVYVAEDRVYKGVIFIKHEIRKDILAALSRLKKEGKKIIMLTGDNQQAAIGFNQQNGGVFDEADIYAQQTPQNKESFLRNLMHSDAINPKGVWFVGDGLNDAPCSRLVSEKGGVSCAMTSDDKAAFFTDISLNGSLDYLFEHQNMNGFLKKNIRSNQGLLAYGSMAFLAFIIAFSIAGIAVSPLIPLLIMASTTLLILFNSYRVQLSVDTALDKRTSWPKRLLASDLSIGLLVGASMLILCGLIISTVATGGLALPILVFTAGAVAAISSACALGAFALFGLFVLLTATHLLMDKVAHLRVKNSDDLPAYTPLQKHEYAPPSALTHHDRQLKDGFSQRSFVGCDKALCHNDEHEEEPMTQDYSLQAVNDLSTSTSPHRV